MWPRLWETTNQPLHFSGSSVWWMQQLTLSVRDFVKPVLKQTHWLAYPTGRASCQWTTFEKYRLLQMDPRDALSHGKLDWRQSSVQCLSQRASTFLELRLSSCLVLSRLGQPPKIKLVPCKISSKTSHLENFVTALRSSQQFLEVGLPDSRHDKTRHMKFVCYLEGVDGTVYGKWRRVETDCPQCDQPSNRGQDKTRQRKLNKIWQ